ncbi:hypothetical protein GE21DRAFT_1206905, partial [Neurospora crassa]
FINNIIITSNTLEEYLKYFKSIFNLFIKKGILISLKKLYLSYPNVKLLNFKVDTLRLTTITKHIITFKNLIFPNQFKTLKHYISNLGFL